MEETEQWLDFDHEKFEGLKVKDGEESWFQGFLNMSVTNDRGGGNQERTVVTFDTHGHGGNPMNVQAEALAHVNPQMAELAKSCRQHFVAGRQCVGQCSFPAPRARRGEDKRCAIFTAKNIFQPSHDGMGQVREIG